MQPVKMLEDVGPTFFLNLPIITLPETNIVLENRPSQKETIVFQPLIFLGELLVFKGVAVEERKPPT